MLATTRPVLGSIAHRRSPGSSTTRCASREARRPHGRRRSGSRAGAATRSRPVRSIPAASTPRAATMARSRVACRSAGARAHGHRRRLRGGCAGGRRSSGGGRLRSRRAGGRPAVAANPVSSPWSSRGANPWARRARYRDRLDDAVRARVDAEDRRAVPTPTRSPRLRPRRSRRSARRPACAAGCRGHAPGWTPGRCAAAVPCRSTPRPAAGRQRPHRSPAAAVSEARPSTGTRASTRPLPASTRITAGCARGRPARRRLRPRSARRADPPAQTATARGAPAAAPSRARRASSVPRPRPPTTGRPR